MEEFEGRRKLRIPQCAQKTAQQIMIHFQTFSCRPLSSSGARLDTATHSEVLIRLVDVVERLSVGVRSGQARMQHGRDIFHFSDHFHLPWGSLLLLV